MTFNVMESLAKAFAYLFTEAIEIFKALWFPTLIYLMAVVWVTPQLMELQLAQFDAAQRGAPDEFSGEIFRLSSITFFALLVFYPMMIAGVLGPLVRGRFNRLPYYFRFFKDELNVLAGGVLVALMLFLVYLAGVLGVIVVVFVFTFVNPILAGVLGAIAGIALCGVLIWFSVRLSLTPSAAVGEGNLGISASWRLTKGAAAGLSAYWGIWTVLMIGIYIIFILIIGGDTLGLFFKMMANVSDEQAVIKASRDLIVAQRDMWIFGTPRFWISVVGSFIYMIVTTGLWLVFNGVAYRELEDQS